MRKVLQLLANVVDDIDEARTKLEACIDDDTVMRDNENVCNKAEQAEKQILTARRMILHAADALQQIYKSYYEKG